MLHIAKVKPNEQEFEIIFEQSGLLPQFKPGFFEAVYPHIEEIRELLMLENKEGTLNYKNFDWKLNLVTNTRSKQKILQPKYTVKIEMMKETEKDGEQ
mmetsp:Transcript_4426/g.4170  ORF Transcript_4426/g.4170 Transcript_4426/m.4170 type:complete len:98 (-) Transcript_4426:129-422(-)